MGKPGNSVYEKFVNKCEVINRQLGKEQYLVPYLMSSHPGSTLKDAITLAEYIRDSTFNAQIMAKHSPEEAATMRNLVGMANNLNQLTKLSHQAGFNRTKNILMELLEKLKAVMNEYKSSERRQL